MDKLNRNKRIAKLVKLSESFIFKKNLDYGTSILNDVDEFLKLFPNGIRDWLEINKCAKIRTNDGTTAAGACPFGLPITQACQSAGNCVLKMKELKNTPENQQNNIEKFNKRIFIYNKTNERCLFADNVMKDKNAVNCDYGEFGAGFRAPTFNGSPLYPQQFSGVSGMGAEQYEYYLDNGNMRNLPFGLFSLLGSAKK
jgi:hypothetical protein